MRRERATYATEISIYANNRIGMYVDIARIFTEREIDVTNMNARTNKQGKATITMSFDIHGTEELNTLMAKIRQIDGVLGHREDHRLIKIRGVCHAKRPADSIIFERERKQ